VTRRPEAPVTLGGDVFDNGINLVGNLTADPDLKVTSGGVAVVRFRLACSRRIFDRTANEWRDGDPAFFSVTAWRQLAQNIHTSLRKGDRAVVVGRIRQSSYENSNHEKRISWEVEADAVGAELSWSYAQVQRARRAAVDSPDTSESAGGFTSEDGQGPGVEARDSIDADLSYLGPQEPADERGEADIPEPVSV
jgi:single-strand DNA-binding protein